MQATQPVTDGTEDRWHYEIMGQKFGPSPISELIRSARDGFLTRDTLVRQGTQSDWVSADRCPQLADVFRGQDAESDETLTDYSTSSFTPSRFDDGANESNAELNDLQRRIRVAEKRLVEVDTDLLPAVERQLRELYTAREQLLADLKNESEIIEAPDTSDPSVTATPPQVSSEAGCAISLCLLLAIAAGVSTESVLVAAFVFVLLLSLPGYLLSRATRRFWTK